MYEQYTDKQIVEMLGSKLRKLGYSTFADNSKYYPDIYKLISTIYKSGYIRGQLGRSFIIGESKQSEHWVPATRDNVKVGSKVKMINSEMHNKSFYYFPVAGTIGIAKTISPYNCEVQWPRGTTIEDDRWWSNYEYLEVLLCE